MARFAILIVLLAASTSLVAAAPSERIQLREDRHALTSQLRFIAPENKVAWTDLFRGISRLNGYDDRELGDTLPAAGFSLHGRFARWSMHAFNWLMQPCVQCSITSEKTGAARLDIAVDRAASRQYVNDAKSKVRAAWNTIDWRREFPRYGIELLEKPAHGQDVVLLVHGLNSRPEELQALVRIVQDAGLAPAVFRYPNDQPIDASAALLSAELKFLKQQFPASNVRLLTHSMGGLVARATVESLLLDPGNVSQCIMIAPPNHGSTLARIATLLDCYEFFTSDRRRGAGLLVESVSDGLGEATADLEPHSVFLDKLNSRWRNPHVRYTILLGSEGPLQPAEMDCVRRNFRKLSDHGRYLRFAASKINSALTDLDEVVDGQGDGVVSVASGRLTGVNDVVVLPFSHRSILNPDAETSPEAYAIVQQRLRSMPASAVILTRHEPRD